MATPCFTRSRLTAKQSLELLFSRSYNTASAAAVPISSSFPFRLLLRLCPLVSEASGSYFRRLVPWNSTRAFSTLQIASSLNDTNRSWSNRPLKDMISFAGCDFEHWRVILDPPESDPTRDEIIDSYIKTLAKVVGSEEEARMKIYSVSTRHYFAFGALVSQQMSNKIKELPGVRMVLPDSYVDAKYNDYGGEPFIDGQAVPYDPKYHEEWVKNEALVQDRIRRNNRDRPQNSDKLRNFCVKGGMQGHNSGANAGGPDGNDGGQPNMASPQANAPDAELKPPITGEQPNYGGAAPPNNRGNSPAKNMRGPANNAPNHQYDPGPNSGGALLSQEMTNKIKGEPFSDGQAVSYDHKYHEVSLKDDSRVQQRIRCNVRGRPLNSCLTRGDMQEQNSGTNAPGGMQWRNSGANAPNAGPDPNTGGVLVAQEMSNKITEMPGVRMVLANSHGDVKNEDYGGEPLIRGHDVPYDPKNHVEWVRKNAQAQDRMRRNVRSGNFDSGLRRGDIQGQNSVAYAGGQGAHHGGQPNMAPPQAITPNAGSREPNMGGQPYYGGGVPPNNPGNSPASNIGGPADNAPNHMYGPGPNGGGAFYQPGPNPNLSGFPSGPGQGQHQNVYGNIDVRNRYQNQNYLGRDSPSPPNQRYGPERNSGNFDPSVGYDNQNYAPNIKHQYGPGPNSGGVSSQPGPGPNQNSFRSGPSQRRYQIV